MVEMKLKAKSRKKPRFVGRRRRSLSSPSSSSPAQSVVNPKKKKERNGSAAFASNIDGRRLLETMKARVGQDLVTQTAPLQLTPIGIGWP